jgi:hypothetical protein
LIRQTRNQVFGLGATNRVVARSRRSFLKAARAASSIFFRCLTIALRTFLISFVIDLSFRIA